MFDLWQRSHDPTPPCLACYPLRPKNLVTFDPILMKVIGVDFGNRSISLCQRDMVVTKSSIAPSRARDRRNLIVALGLGDARLERGLGWVDLALLATARDAGHHFQISTSAA